MRDLIAEILGHDFLENGIVILCFISAAVFGFLAFALTPDAGFRCWRALLRSAHRVTITALAVSAMWLGVFDLQNAHHVSGPAFVFILMVFINGLVSACRLMMAPLLPQDSRWPWQLNDSDLAKQYPLIHQLKHRQHG